MKKRKPMRAKSDSSGYFDIQKHAIYPYLWVICFFLFCFVIYTHSIQNKRKAIFVLEKHLHALQKEKEGLLLEKEELLLNIHSQRDPAWVELVLMKGLGLVPEGKIKVYFDSIPQ